VIRYLNQNKIVAILTTRGKAFRAVFVEFFGVKVPTLKGP
jgi:lauroyl/myristoyl acyltransferase